MNGLLSEPQGFVLETLRQFNALRLDQIKWLLQTKYKDQYGVLNIRSVMRQLAYMGKVQAQENLWCALWRKPVPALIDAYPLGLAGESIPYLARLVAIADAYEAMTAGRPYQKAISRQQALRTISEGAGNQFDPILAGLFCAAQRNA